MRETTIAAIALLLVSQVAYGSPETTLKRQYDKAIKQSVSKHETRTLLWVGNGLLNGYVFTEDAAGPYIRVGKVTLWNRVVHVEKTDDGGTIK